MTRRHRLALLMFLCLAATALVPVTAGAAPDRDGRSVKKISYGAGVEISRLSGDERKLTGTPRSFKRFVRARLDELFEEAGSRPRCATSPLVVVDRYHGEGWAHAGEGWYGKCPAGGYNVLYEKTSSGWRTILGTQEVRFCQDLAWYGVPAFIGGHRCMDEDIELVRYHRGSTATKSPEATARRVFSVSGGNPIVPAEEVLSRPAAEQLAVVIARKGYLSLDTCVRAGDGGDLASHLGDAPYGCAVTATYRREKKESIMLRMNDDFVVTELFEL